MEINDCSNADKRIILVNFPSNEAWAVDAKFEENYGYNPSFSLIALGTWLELNGYKVSLIDLYAEQMEWNKFIDLIVESNLLFLGCSIHTENALVTLSVLKKIKERKPNLKVVLGGPHATLCPEDMIRSELVDFVSVKEGEGTLVELAEAISTDEKMIRYEQINGLIFKRNNKIITTEPREFISDMDLLPIPKRELFKIERYRNVLNMITGRGCPGNCIYCAANVLSGKKYRSRDIDNVFLEVILMKHIMGPRFRKVYFVDDTFTVSKERVLKFVNNMRKYSLKMDWMCQSRVDTIDTEMIDELAESGCSELLYGVESGNQEVVHKIGKQIKLEQVWKVMEYTHQKNVHIQCSFILGHYCDTLQTMEDTYNMVKKIYEAFGADIAIYLNTPYPGTCQYINRDKLGLRIKEKDYSKYSNITAIVETDNFTREDQIQIHQRCLEFFGRHKKIESIIEDLMQSVSENGG